MKDALKSVEFGLCTRLLLQAMNRSQSVDCGLLESGLQVGNLLELQRSTALL
jgi:hypothetical protein